MYLNPSSTSSLLSYTLVHNARHLLHFSTPWFHLLCSLCSEFLECGVTQCSCKCARQKNLGFKPYHRKMQQFLKCLGDFLRRYPRHNLTSKFKVLTKKKKNNMFKCAWGKMFRSYPRLFKQCLEKLNKQDIFNNFIFA